jgi:tetratricopeptide (TPR) repeat protein
MADALYNKGLARAKLSDLSGALECLRKAVDINKNHIEARNLLGLVEFEVGHVGSALKHWVISAGMKPEDNLARGYIELAQRNGRLLERLNDAARSYNQALGDIHQKSDDMAMIQLKKAVEVNPKFIDALNLLTFCYLIQRNRERALAIAERVLAMDANNPIAAHYYNETAPNRGATIRNPRNAPQSTGTAPAKPTGLNPFGKKPIESKKRSNFHLLEIAAFVVGALVMFAVLYVLVIPAIERNRDEEIGKARDALTQAQTEHQQEMSKLEEENERLNSRVKTYENTENALRREIDEYERTGQVWIAYDMFRNNDHQRAVDALELVHWDDLPSNIQAYAELIVNTSYPWLANRYYNDGLTAFNANDMLKARVDFDNAFRYASPGTTMMGNILFNLGRTYSRGFSNEQAAHFLRMFTEDDAYLHHINRAAALTLLSEINQAMGVTAP